MRVATGVPLLEVLETMTLPDATWLTVALFSATFAFVIVVPRLVAFLSSRLGDLVEAGQAGGEEGIPQSWLPSLVGDVIRSLERPTSVIFPLFGIFYSCTILASFVLVCLKKVGVESTTRAACSLAISKVLDVAQLLQDTSEVSILVFLSWVWLGFKDRLVKRLMTHAANQDRTEHDSLARIVFPLSTLITWATVVATSLIGLHLMGINVRPALAFGSVSTLAIGIAAQSTVANIMAAVSFYTNRPFIAGDRVLLKSMNGATVVNGTVERIRPINTVIRTDAGIPIFIHNKDIATSLLVHNESDTSRKHVTPGLPHLETTITVRYQDVDRVPNIQRAANAYLKSHPDTIHVTKCALTSFDLYGCVFLVRITLMREADDRKSDVFMELLTGLERIVRHHGAFLAMKKGVVSPPALNEP